MKPIGKSLIPTVLFTAGVLAASLVHAEEAPPDPCSELTPSAFDALTASLTDSIAQATTDCSRFCVTGAYASAPQANLDLLREVLGQVQVLESWLVENELDQPYVSNASAAYNVHGLARDAMLSLHHARHWATISASYHGSASARLSFDLTTRAIHQLEALGENGGLCYMAPYGPFPN